MEFWHFANNCSLPRTILYSLLVSSAWVLVQKLHMRSTIVLEQDKYWRSLREISPPKISAFSTFLLCLLSIYIYYSGICLHRFELKVLHTLQNCPLVSCFLNSFRGTIWQKQLFNTTETLCFWTTFLSSTPTCVLL